jgi:hypothetical protein
VRRNEAASMATSVSKAAPSSVRSESQSSRARCHSAPCGGVAATFEVGERRVVGAIMPARAPASMLMLQTVIRPSIDRADGGAAVLDDVADAAAGAMRPMMARMTSLAVTPAGRCRRR